jgi:hypothetical protein
MEPSNIRTMYKSGHTAQAARGGSDPGTLHCSLLWERRCRTSGNRTCRIWAYRAPPHASRSLRPSAKVLEDEIKTQKGDRRAAKEDVRVLRAAPPSAPTFISRAKRPHLRRSIQPMTVRLRPRVVAASRSRRCVPLSICRWSTRLARAAWPWAMKSSICACAPWENCCSRSACACRASSMPAYGDAARNGDADESVSDGVDVPPTRRLASEVCGARSSDLLAACCYIYIYVITTACAPTGEEEAYLVGRRDAETLKLGTHVCLILPKLLHASVFLIRTLYPPKIWNGRTTEPSPASRR